MQSLSKFKIDNALNLSCNIFDPKYIFTDLRQENSRSDVTLEIGLDIGLSK